MTNNVVIVPPSPQSLAEFADLLEIEEILKIDSVLPWLLANGFDYDDAYVYAEVIDECTSIDQVYDSELVNFHDLPDVEKSKMERILKVFFL
ncbi:hypothetical protein PN465_11470 [Nodularia spumigena CS-584]|jgi:hypothetical protein|uniref:hypothetical protein n=1 Tax=Nodularia spumigena TaxID=70799 RepID=UPI0000EAAEE1|nr:hypothetical protein [Nodularia spumigena]AHJ28586.1 hypothetical protein NSP_22540 [Nodularia spumigena CCY9414]EAW43333.1 hypothetical protein N9414_06374 [Nodularia spumigena CCY9414]MDB9382835.1 hypothetical protein [Nodularia spumigena CS-584]